LEEGVRAAEGWRKDAGVRAESVEKAISYQPSAFRKSNGKVAES
jgi:hypothetical protein